MMSRIALAGGLLLLGSFASQAAEVGWYAGLSLGQAEYDLYDGSLENGPSIIAYKASTDSKDFGFGVFGGYQWNRWLALETSLNHFGAASNSYAYTYTTPVDTLQASGNGKLEASAVAVSALLTVPLGESFSLGLRAGGAYSRLESEANQTFRFNADPVENVRSKRTKSGTEPTYGANVEFKATSNVSIRLDWQIFKNVGGRLALGADGPDVDLTTLSVIGRF